MENEQLNKNHFRFVKMKAQDVQAILSKREGETKLGEELSDLQSAKYVVIGVEESIGPRANGGREGAENGFAPFLKAFLNMQSNEFMTGEKVHVLGTVVSIGAPIQDLPASQLKERVEELDDYVLSVLKMYVAEGQIPILIGGGHNNALPLIVFSHHRFNEAINVVNLDAHADYRLLEGRHSGNSFSYAFNRELIHKYFVMGLHHQYNSQQILDDLRRDKHYFTFHDDYVVGKRDYKTDFTFLSDSLAETNRHLGVELDLDVIENMPSSASSPVGIPLSVALLYLKTIPLKSKIAYLHLPEGAPTDENENRIIGKTLAYLVADFICACNASLIK